MIEISTSMSRLPLSDPSTVPGPCVRAVYGEIEQELGFGMVPNVFRALGHQPQMLRATWDLFRAVMLQGELPRSVKEMVGVVVSAANQSEYALRVHLHSLGMQEVNEEILDALAGGKDSAPGLAPSVNAVLRVAHTAARHGPQAVTEADIAHLEREGLSREELTEVIAAVALFQYVNSLTDLIRVPIDAI